MNRTTEGANPASADFDLLPTLELLRVINAEDRGVPEAVVRALPELARAVDATAERIRGGGRVFYIGAGTSGRLGVLDASEIPPTFGVTPDMFRGVIAGGYAACHAATEASEDDSVQGGRDLQEHGCGSRDVVVGIAASGATPYTVGAVRWARSIGALTVALACNPDSPLAASAEIAIAVIVGPEVLAGSTRMKAGTAQKLVLNMFSTATMVRLGHVYSHWMINVEMGNRKLRARGLRILTEATGRSESECAEALEAAGTRLKVALVMLLAGVGAAEAGRILDGSGGDVRRAVAGKSRR